MQKRIILSGVHGVGKGYFLEMNVRGRERFEILSASNLIRKHKQGDDAGYKKVKDVSDNQTLLLHEFKSACEVIGKDVILDGHLCIINAAGGIENVPLEFFQDASINGILLLQEKSELIAERQRKRDELSFSISLIEQIQDAELQYCRFLLEKHGLPFKVINGESSYMELCEFVDCI